MNYVEKVDMKIENALFTLMEDQRLSVITVTQIVQKAKVSRASFYRNFCSREDIIKRYIGGLILDIFDIIRASDTPEQRLKDILLLAEEERSRLVILLKQGYEIELLQFINREILNFAQKNGKAKNINSLYVYVGGIFNLVINWLFNDCQDTAADLCRIISDTIDNPDFSFN